jgi:hypothetical protein
MSNARVFSKRTYRLEEIISNDDVARESHSFVMGGKKALNPYAFIGTFDFTRIVSYLVFCILPVDQFFWQNVMVTMYFFYRNLTR